MKEPSVILVDQQDRVTGSAGKLEAHRKNLLHRAFSVLFYRYQSTSLEVLLQKRQVTKYHCPGLWSNTCCSHPRPGQDCLESAIERLGFELNIDFQDLTFVSKFYYQHTFSPNLHEHELDYVYIGHYDEPLLPANLDEVAELAWFNYDQLITEIDQTPELFTPWLLPVLTAAKQVIRKAK